jgi:DNA-binding NarL/FixJ family response regulator
MAMGIGAVGYSAQPILPQVLLVEDDGLIAMDLEVVVQEAGFDGLGPYATAASALALLAVRRPDAALLDVGLPGRTVPARPSPRRSPPPACRSPW